MGRSLVNHEANILFESIESAQEYLTLLSEMIRDTRASVEADIGPDSDLDRRTVALRLVSYNLAKLELHLRTSHRILNDLRSLRRLLMRERSAMPTPRKPMSLVSKGAA